MEFNHDNDGEVIHLIEMFLDAAGMSGLLGGICALTIQPNRQMLAGTFIFDYTSKRMLPDYPAPFGGGVQVYKRLKGVEWTINVATNLRVIGDIDMPSFADEVSPAEEDMGSYPFCCDACRLKCDRKFTKESIFSNFVNKIGSSKYTFKVVKKQNGGKLIFLKHFILHDGVVSEVEKTELGKINSYQIYVCDVHGTYYGVDLLTNENLYNIHHIKPQNETDYGPKLIAKMMGSI